MSAISNRLSKLVGSGKVSFERALNRKMQRHGLLVVSQRRPFSPVQQKSIARAIERHEEKIAELSSRQKAPKSLVDWQKRASVLRRMRSVGFRPTASIVASSLAFEYGLEKEKLLPQLNSFRVTNIRLKGALFEGEIKIFCDVVRLDLPFRVQELLKNSGLALDSRQIAIKLGLEPTPRNRKLITNSLGLLDLMHLTTKLPPRKEMHYRWLDSSQRFSKQTISKNLDWRILQRLVQREQRLADLSLPVKLPGGKIIGSAKGLSHHGNVKKSLLRLQRAGLVSLKSGVSGFFARLSRYGQKLMNEQSKLSYLHPSLRVALLGMARQPKEPKPAKKRTLELIMRWARVHKALQEARRGLPSDTQIYVGSREVSQNLNEPLGFVRSVAEGRISWKKVPKKQMESFLQQIEQKNPELALHIKNFLKTIKT
ncbi:MAG: hypothetical protein HYW50_02190 [Candidatus Diapherotrites archaeon]|nr:hypothetical protein [Candidatus Diapherotrites archaeon]